MGANPGKRKSPRRNSTFLRDATGISRAKSVRRAGCRHAWRCRVLTAAWARNRPKDWSRNPANHCCRCSERCRRYALRLSVTAAALGGGSSQERASARRPSCADQAPSRQRAPAPPGPAAADAHQRNACKRASRRASPTCLSRTACASSERTSAWFIGAKLGGATGRLMARQIEERRHPSTAIRQVSDCCSGTLEADEHGTARAAGPARTSAGMTAMGFEERTALLVKREVHWRGDNGKSATGERASELPAGAITGVDARWSRHRPQCRDEPDPGRPVDGAKHACRRGRCLLPAHAAARRHRCSRDGVGLSANVGSNRAGPTCC